MSDGSPTGMLAALATWVHRLVHPGFEEERARFARLERLQTEQVGALQREVARLGRQLAEQGVEKSLKSLDRRLEHVAERLTQVREATGRYYKLASQARHDADWQEEQRALEHRVTRRIARIARSGRPVVIGPWSGEVGFELLYWIPFVTWAVERAAVAPERIIVVSRGGAAPWYAHLGGRYADVLSHASIDEFRAHSERAKKQRAFDAFERTLIRRITGNAGIHRPHVLHPDLMYRLFYPFWKQQVPVRRVESFTTHRMLSGMRRADIASRLPAEYAAVRFYFSDSFPDTGANRQFAAATIAALSRTLPVVVLNTPFRMDDHRDYAAAADGRVHTVDDLMTPERNLDVQTAVIAGARAFVGTYGGYAYLAPLCGVDTIAFYSVEDAFFAHHLELAHRVFRQLGAGSLVPIDVRDAGLLKSVFADAAQPQELLRP